MLTYVPDNYINGDCEAYSTSSSFADDLTATVVTEDEETNQMILQKLSDQYVHYFASIGLKVNKSKNEHIVLSTNRSMNIVVDGRPEKKCVKLLGLTFETGWRTSAHIDNIVKRSNFRMANLAKIKHLIPLSLLRQLCDALIMSIIGYAIVMTCTNKANLKRLQTLQNRVMRLCTNEDGKARIASMLTTLKWLSVANTWRLKQVKLLLNILENKICPFSHRLISQHEEMQLGKYETRKADLRIAWYPKKSRAGMSAFIQMIKTYNEIKIHGKPLPKTKKSAKSLISKLIIDKHGLQHKQ